MMQIKILPNDLIAESAVIGGIIYDYKIMAEIIFKLTSADFYKNSHSKIYQTMCEMYDNGDTIDLITLSQKLSGKNILNEVGGNSYLLGISESIHSNSNIGSYVNIITQKAFERKLITQCQRSIEDIYSGEDASETLEKLQTLEYCDAEKETKSFKELCHETIDKIELSRNRVGLSGLHTGMPWLNNMLDGWQNGDLIVLAARPSAGKTSFAIQTARETAIKYHKYVGFFTLEMPYDQIICRIMAQECQISLSNLIRGRLTEIQWKRFSENMSKVIDGRFKIDDHTPVDINYIRKKSYIWKRRYDLSLLIIDYLGLMDLPEAERYDLRIGEITKGLKSIAKKLNIPVILLHHLRRNVEHEGRRPMMSDLSNSGLIERDADVILCTHFQDLGNKENAEMHILKQRNGSTGMQTVGFNTESVNFES